MKPDDYRSAHRVNYEPPDRTGFTDVDVLQFLWGQPWDELALNYVHALRPSCVRVINCFQGQTLDAIGWRVTVHLAEDDRTIAQIDQEAEVGLVGAEHGHDLTMQLRARRAS